MSSFAAVGQKTLGNLDVSAAKAATPDLRLFGDGDAFKLLCKASSDQEGWMKSTKAMEIKSAGCIVQVTTQQRNPDGTYVVAEAVTFVPFVQIEETKDSNGTVVGRKLVMKNWGAE